MSDSVIIYTVGGSGSGKSYVRGVRYIMDEFLPYRKGVLWSNYPLNRDLIVDALAGSLGAYPEDLRDRLQFFPENVLKTWRDGLSGPWDFFAGQKLGGVHIAIDEIHLYAAREHSKEHLQKWKAWLGDLRHAGATVEFLTQSPDKVAKPIESAAMFRMLLVHRGDKRDLVTGFAYTQLWNIWAAFGGRYLESTSFLEERKVLKRWEVVRMQRFTFNPYYFQFYNSYNSTRAEVEGDEPEPKDYEKFGKFRLVLKYINANLTAFFVRCCILAFAIAVVASGFQFPLGTAYNHFIIPMVKNQFKLNTGEKKNEQAAVTPVSSSVVSSSSSVPRPVMVSSPSSVSVSPEIQKALQDAEKRASDAEKSAVAVRELLCKDTGLVGIDSRRVFSFGGRIYRVGDAYPTVSGVFTIQAIDFPNRKVILKGGQQIYVP